MANFMQIIEINSQGGKTVFHPESDADYILPGKQFKVPAILNIEDWISKSNEVTNARKGKSSLREKIDAIDTELLPNNLLETIKKVDGTGSGLDADFIDGRSVNDNGSSSNDIWTANKTRLELEKKLNLDQVTTFAEAGKVLRLNGAGALDASITRNAATATKLQSPISIRLVGDASGQASFNGNEGEVIMGVEIQDNSHNHSGLASTTVPVNIKTNSGSSIVNFMMGDRTKSFIDENGVYNGDCTSLNGFKVNDDREDFQTLWSATRTVKEVVLASTEVVNNALENYTTIDNNQWSIGPFKLYKGVVDIGRLSYLDIDIPVSNIVNENYIINSTNRTLTCVKSPNSNTILFSRPPEEGDTLTWYVIGF